MKNKLTDLNDHLFAEIERLGDEDLTGEKLDEELNRARAVTAVSKQIINNANLILRAQIAKSEAINADMGLPPMLEQGKKDNA